jgi:hypothetical protein
MDWIIDDRVKIVRYFNVKYRYSQKLHSERNKYHFSTNKWDAYLGTARLLLLLTMPRKLMNSWNRPNFSWPGRLFLTRKCCFCHIIVFDLMNNFKYNGFFFHLSFLETPIQSRLIISLGISQNQGFCTMKCSAVTDPSLE